MYKRQVEFVSHLNGKKHFFTPEKAIDIQLALGSDILMVLDVCPAGTASFKEVEKAVELTSEWAKRAKIYFDKKTKNLKNRPLLFGIVQGGVFKNLRKKSAHDILKLNFDGIAIGGLAVGEEKSKMWRVVKLMDKILPKEKPRYLMGVGEIEDFVKAVSLGIDFVDCVVPTRLARHGVVLKVDFNSADFLKGKIKLEKLDLRKSWAKKKLAVLDSKCHCPVCQQKFSISYLAHLVRENDILGYRLLTLHNLYNIAKLFKMMQKS